MADFTWLGRNPRALTLVLLATLMISACGGGDEGPSGTDNGTGVVVLGSSNTGGNTANSGSGPITVQGVSSISSLTVSGIVIDGPVIDAILTITDANNAFVAATRSNAQARFSVQIPANSVFPLTITAAKGTNLVTNAPPTFSMVSTILSAEDTTANINPFTTLIVKTAAKMAGGLTPENLEAANHNILTVFNAGLDPAMMPNPITTPVTNQNVTMLVKASEVLAEIIRRNFSAVSSVNIQTTENLIIDSLAADMTDGVLDGKGAAGADRLISSSASVISGQVLIEALSNDLQVNDAPVTGQLDSAISIIMPTASESTGELPINTEMLLNTQTAIAAALLIAPSIALSDIQTTVNSLESGTTSTEVSTLLLADASDSLDPAITTLTSSTDSQTLVLTSVSTPINAGTQAPFNGAPWVLPGNIEAENYDLGGPGVAYSDTTIGNSRNTYRHDDVDVFASDDIGGGYMIGVTNATEWLEYTVNVASTGTYTLNLRVATALDSRQVRVLTNGSDVTGPILVPNTGSWGTWQTISKTVRLNAGQQVLRLQIDSGSVNINSIGILAGDTTTQPDVVDNTKLTVSWSPNPESIDGYIVYFGPSASAVTNETTDIQAFAGSFDTASPAIEYDSWYDLGLQLGDNVCFKLRAYNADGLSDWSLPACTTVPLTI